MDSAGSLGSGRRNGRPGEDAASGYRIGLELEEVAEELYRRMIVCHIKLGQEAEAISIYRRCRKTLASLLGVIPSSETPAIASSLGRPPI